VVKYNYLADYLLFGTGVLKRTLVNLEKNRYIDQKINDDDVTIDEDRLYEMNRYVSFSCDSNKLEFRLCCCNKGVCISTEIFDDAFVQKFQGRLINNNPQVKFYKVPDLDTEKKCFVYVDNVHKSEKEISKDLFLHKLQSYEKVKFTYSRRDSPGRYNLVLGEIIPQDIAYIIKSIDKDYYLVAEFTFVCGMDFYFCYNLSETK
jgi:hypothetical protein